MRLFLSAFAKLCALLFVCLPYPAAASDREKIDVVTLLNGDRITCEIISLRYGILTVKTSNIETIKIEWPAIAGLATPYEFFVEDIYGNLYFGVVRALSNGRLTVSDASGDVADLPILNVARLSQIEKSFFERVTGSLSFGYNYTKSSDISVGTFGLNATYRSRAIESTLNVNLNSSKDSSGESTDRNKISNITNFARPTRNYWSLLGSLESNEELGIEERLQIGAGVGRHMWQHSTYEISGIVGVTFTQEWTTETADESKQSAEGVLAGEWRVFRFTDPETALNMSLLVYPSLTESGRWRGDYNVSYRQKFWGDFTFDLSYYYTYDNQPPDPAASHNDYGIVTSLGYTF